MAIETPQPTGYCFCGCGAQTGPGAHFAHGEDLTPRSGHDAVAAYRIIRERFGGVASFVRAFDPTAGMPPVQHPSSEGERRPTG